MARPRESTDTEGDPVKKYIVAIAALAVMAPASTAYAGADYKVDNRGPSVSVGGLLGGGGESGDAIQIFGQEIEGLQSQGSARHRYESDTTAQTVTYKEELRVKTSGVEGAQDGEPVGYIALSEIIDNGLDLRGALPLGEINGDTAELDYKYEGAVAETDSLQIGHCGDWILGVPLGDGLGLPNILVSSVAPDGDAGTGLVAGFLTGLLGANGRPLENCELPQGQVVLG
jgi:hypothetical protein